MAREMKDSGIEWIGNIPSNWNMIRNKYLFDCSKSIVGEDWALTQLLSLTTKGIIEKDPEHLSGKVPESFDTYQVVVPDNIVMCLFDLDCSAVFSGISRFKGMISPAYKVLSCKEIIHPLFADLWFSFVFNGRKYKSYSKNLRYTLNYDEFAVIETPIPPLEEQFRIAAFLDRKCAEIDSVMADTQRTIEEYKRLKQSIITEAVTKGVRGKRPMKDSGIEWIGQIPEEWDVPRIKNIIQQTKDGIKIGPFGSALTNKTTGSDEYNVYSQANLIAGDYSKTKNTVSQEVFEQLIGYEVFSGDICLSMMGTIGKCKIVPRIIE